MAWGWNSVVTTLGLPDFIALINQKMKLLEGNLSDRDREKLGWFNIKRFGGRGIGKSDSTAIQSAITAAEESGGVVYFGDGRWGVDQAHTVSSVYPVHLLANMGPLGNRSPWGSYITPLTSLAGSIFRYVTPAGATRGEAGGGLLRGLVFFDASDRLNANVKARRVQSITAAIELTDFGNGAVEDCHFYYLKGSAIRTDSFITSSIRGCQARFCGDVGRPGFDISSTDATYYSQGSAIIDCGIEVHFDAEYIKLDSRATSIKVALCGFESDPIGSPTSGQTFVNDTGLRNQLLGNHFNRTTSVAVIMSSVGTATGNTFSGNTSGSLKMNGTAGSATGNTFYDNQSQTVPTVEVAGTDNEFSGANTLYGCGGIVVSGPGGKANGNNIYDPAKNSGYVIDLTAPTGDAINNTIKFPIQSLTTGGIRSVVGPNIIESNKVRNALVGIDLQSSTANVTGNEVATCTTPITGALGFVGNNTFRDNQGFVTENNGQANVLSGTTSIVVSHGLSTTPAVQDISVTPINNLGSATKFWVSAVGATTFTISVDADPGVSGAAFGWVAVIQ